jgi:L-asparaginase
MFARKYFAFCLVLLMLPLSAMARPGVVILATGGTIAGAAKSSTDSAYKTGTVLVDTLVEAVPEMNDVANVSAEQLANIGSQDMSFEVWIKLANRINELLKRSDVHGVVVTHGTDTLEETAYFLNLVVNSDKPVVVTGAMRSSTALSADGPSNLFRAVSTAASDNARGRGVLVVLNDDIHSARAAAKMHTFSVNTFQSINSMALGTFHDGKPVFVMDTPKQHTQTSAFAGMKLGKPEDLPKVEVVYGHSEMSDIQIRALIEAGVDGIVFAGVGDGSMNKNVVPGFHEAMKKGIVVVRSSHVPFGGTTTTDWGEKYHGMVPSLELTPHKARILLMLALTKSRDARVVRDYFMKH